MGERRRKAPRALVALQRLALHHSEFEPVWAETREARRPLASELGCGLFFVQTPTMVDCSFPPTRVQLASDDKANPRRRAAKETGEVLPCLSIIKAQVS